MKGLRKSTGLEIEAERKKSGPFEGIADLLRRVPSVNKREIRQLSLSGALTFGKDRRGSLWDAEREIQKVGPLLKNLRERPKRSPLKPMSELENLSDGVEPGSDAPPMVQLIIAPLDGTPE